MLGQGKMKKGVKIVRKLFPPPIEIERQIEEDKKYLSDRYIFINPRCVEELGSV